MTVGDDENDRKEGIYDTVLSSEYTYKNNSRNL